MSVSVGQVRRRSRRGLETGMLGDTR